jgi:benzoylformate decarboxylase
LLRLYLYLEPARPIPEGARLIHLDADPWELGKNYPVKIGLLADPKAGLAELAQHLSHGQTEDQARTAARRFDTYVRQRQSERKALLAEIDAQWDRRPMTSQVFMAAVGRALPPNAAVVDEAVTTSNAMLEQLGVLEDPSGHFGHRGWALGWGLGCALGVKLAWPDRPVLALLGDGAALYGIQGLWTAAHHHIPATFVIANNTQYKILKDAAKVIQLPQMRKGNYLGMDLVGPEVDFVGLARSFGVEAHRVADPEELSDRVREALSRTEPILLDVAIER